MADSLLDPDQIARKTFLAGFRGYEQQEVRAFLHDLAQQARDLQRQLFEAETRLAELEPMAAQRDAPIDPSRLAMLVGEETARVLDAARSAADEITSKAEEAAARVVKEATAEAQQTRQRADDDARDVREEAGEVLGRRTEEAEAAANEIVGRAERDAATVRADADADHARQVADAERVTDEATEQAERIVEEAKAHGRSIVNEAKALRHKVLEDLGRRRHIAREQVERLNAGRERLLAAYDVVQQTLDAANGELTNAVGQARAAADTAALRVQEEALPTVEELEAELGAAVDADLLGAWHEPPDTPEADADNDAGADADTDEADADDVEFDPADGATPDPDLGEDARSTAAPKAALRFDDTEDIHDDGEPGAVGDAGDLEDLELPSGPAGRSHVPVVTTDALPELDADQLDGSPIEEPPTPIVVPRRGPKRRLFGRDAPREATLLPPAELVPLTERNEVEGVRIVSPTAAEAADIDIDAEDDADIDSADDAGVVDDSMPAVSGDAGPTSPDPDADQDDLDAADPAGALDESDESDEIDTDEIESDESGDGPDLSIVPEPEPTGAPPPVATKERVDELFARIRAERADTLEAAHDTLDRTDLDTGADNESGVAVESAAPVDVAAEGVDGAAAVGEPDGGSPTDEDRLALVAMTERDEALSPLAKELGKRLKRALADEQNELLDAIRRASDDDVLAHLPDARGHASTYITAVGSVLVDAAEAGVAHGGSGETPDTGPIARAMAEAICFPLRDRFERARAEADGDPDELDTRVRACYREWKSSVLPDVADDALVRSWSAGLIAGVGAGCAIRWLVAPDGAPCPDADDNALEGPIVAGQPFPTGDLIPPAHPGCRCLVVRASQ